MAYLKEKMAYLKETGVSNEKPILCSFFSANLETGKYFLKSKTSARKDLKKLPNRWYNLQQLTGIQKNPLPKILEEGSNVPIYMYYFFMQIS